jgi:hypothetical protein
MDKNPKPVQYSMRILLRSSSQGGWDKQSIQHRWEIINAHKHLAAKPEEERLLETSKCRSMDNIKMDLKVIGCEDVNWIMIQW